MLEAELRHLHESKDYRGLATKAMREYGGELFRFVRASICNDQDVADVNSELWEDIWTGLPNFQWRASFRTWAYTLARHACTRHLRHPSRKKLRPLSDADLSRLENHLRTSIWYLQDGTRSKLLALRERLKPDERALIFLRVDRNMSWKEIALVMEQEGRPESEVALRKQYSRLKDQIREMAKREGLLPES